MGFKSRGAKGKTDFHAIALLIALIGFFLTNHSDENNSNIFFQKMYS